jgi:phosphonate transport system substrate-binding protein
MQGDIMRRKHLFVVATLAWIATAPVAAEPANSGVPDIKFGSVAMDIPVVMHKRLRPLTEYLSKELKRPVSLQLSPDLTAAADAVADGHVHIAYLTPVAYIKANEKGGARLVAKMVTKGESSFRLMIVVRQDSPIRTARDLRGKHFAFGDKAAILQRAVVVNAGVKLEELGSYKFIGHYDNIARGVANGDFDAGILKDTTAYQWEQKGLRVIHSSPSLPPYNIVVSRNVDDRLLRKIRDAFLKLNAATPGHLDAIKSLDPSYDGFAKTTDAEYDVVRRLVKPFEK